MNFPDPLSPQYKAGVLLINTGSPDTPDAASVRRYLAEFLSDERVIELPKWKWWHHSDGTSGQVGAAI